MAAKKALVVAIGFAVLVTWLLQPVEQGRLQSPDGHYTAVIQSARLWQWLPALPAHGGDRPARVSMLDRDGREFGSIPVASVSQAYEIRWLHSGASIRLAGAWNFQEGFYAYWNHDRTAMITEQLAD